MHFDLINSYNEIDEENRLQSSQARRVEYISTVESLGKSFFPGMKILDCGCGVGIYSLMYAKLGAEVIALDIVPKHINRLSEISVNENIQLTPVVGDAKDLSRFHSEEFDLTLCLGPLYHLISEDEQVACINECSRVTKKDGIIAFAYISPYSVFPCVIRGDANRAKSELVEKIVKEKFISSDDRLCFWTDNYYYTPDDIESRLKMYNLEIIDHLATDGQSIAFQSVVNNLDEKAFSVWMNYHRLICRERSILGSSNHGLIIARKK